MFMKHPTMESDDMRQRTQGVWDRFYNFSNIWKRSGCVKSLKSRLMFVLISKLYRAMYASTGIATDSARKAKANSWARLLLKPTRRRFQGPPLPPPLCRNSRCRTRFAARATNCFASSVRTPCTPAEPVVPIEPQGSFRATGTAGSVMEPESIPT